MINFNKKSDSKIFGYSVIEIVVYLSVFTVMSILVINSLIIIMSSFSKTVSNNKILKSGMVSMERISREVRKSKNINTTNQSLNSLTLNYVDDFGENKSIYIVHENDNINLYEDGSLIGGLIDNNLIVESLIFRRIFTTESEAIKIEMILRDEKTPNPKSENFYNTIVLRGSY